MKLTIETEELDWDFWCNTKIDILETLKKIGPSSVTDITYSLERPYSVIHKHVKDLIKKEIIEKKGNKNILVEQLENALRHPRR